MPQTSMLTVPGSMPTTRGIDSRLLRHQLPRDVGDRLGVQHEVVALEQACDARLVQLRLEVADGERAEAHDALLRDAVIHRLDAFDAERRDRVHVGHDLRSEEHTSELQSRLHLVCRLLLEKKKKKK